MTSEGEQNTHLALYRKYRPTKLADVIGQPQVTDILAAMAKTGQFAHSYLFTGQRGTGKTTVARILAHLINQLDYEDGAVSQHVDIIEIDAASNNSVDDIRNLRDSINLAPMQCPYKVYIIDEFHMLSKAAFNALLKTIEEPPRHAIFILATTELQKVPATILSRVQRYQFRTVAPDVLAKHLRKICDNEHITIDDAALQLIAEQGGGSVRDSITILDQMASSGQAITCDQVEHTLGLITGQQLTDLWTAIGQQDSPRIIQLVQTFTASGIGATSIARQLIKFLTRQASASPALYALIDQLLEVDKSAMPEAKLIAVLVCASLKANATAKIHVGAMPQLNVIIDQATEPKPTAPAKPAAPTSKATKNTPAPATTEAQSVTTKPAQPAQPKSAAANNTISNSSTTAAEPASATSEVTATAATPAPENFDGNLSLELIEDKLKEADEVSAASLIRNCEYRYNKSANLVTFFFGKAFHRKKADTDKFRSAVARAITAEYRFTPSIEISKDKVPADSDASKVMEIMGGGEVVTNDEF